MAQQAYAYVTLIPVAQGFQKAVAKEMGGVNDVGKKAGDDAGKGFSSGFGTALKGLAVVGGALAVAGITNFVKDSISAASDLGESLNALQVTYSDLGAGAVGELEAIGASAAKNFGLSQSEFNGFAVQFSSFATKIAGPGGDVVGTLESITGRAADFASVMNLEVAEAAAIFQSGLAGETEPLKKFGIDLSAAAVEAFAMANGIGEAGRQLTESEKVQARYGALMEQTAKTEGDFANTSDSLANSQRILAATFENVKAEVGGPLLGAFANLTTALIPVVNELAPVLVAVMEDLAPIIAELAGEIPGLLTSLMPLLPVLGQLAAVFFEMVAQLLPVFVDLFMALLPIITELVPIIASFISDAMAILVPIIVQLVEALAPIVEALLPVFAELFEALAPVVLQLVEAMLPLIQLLLPIFIQLIEFLTPILVTVSGIIGAVLVGAIGFFVEAITWVTTKLDEFGKFFNNLWTGIKQFFEDIINGFIAGFEGFVNFIIKGVNFIIDALNRIKVEIPDWDIFGDLAGKTFGFNFARIAEISLGRVAFANGGFVTGPTNALIGEAGPEVVMPLDRFERMMGLNGNGGQTVNYYAAPNASLTSEDELLMAMRRAKLVVA